MTKQYNYKDNFEMIYLRHDLIKKVKSYDPQWFVDKKPFVDLTAFKCFNKFKALFKKVGFEQEDIVSIANLYMICYMSNYSFESKKRNIKKYHENCKQHNITPNTEKSENNSLINFLIQKLEHCAVVCQRKSSNIIADRLIVKYLQETESSIYAEPYNIFLNPQKFNFTKITKKKYDEYVSKCGNNPRTKEGFRLIKVTNIPEDLNNKDYSILFNNSSNNIYLNDAESMCIEYEEEAQLEFFKDKFNNLNTKNKKQILKKFINIYKNNRKYKDEIKTARKKLKNMV